MATDNLPIVLVTGFGPLKDWPSNASEDLVRSLQAELPQGCAGATYHFAVLDAQTKTLDDQLAKLIAEVSPDYCILFGQARGRTMICIERAALNLVDFEGADADGVIVRGEPVVDGAPAAYFSNLSMIEDIVPSLVAAGYPAKYSQHAGNSLCNQVYFHALHQQVPQTVFVHIPLTPRQVVGEWGDAPFVTLDFLREAFELLTAVIVGEGRPAAR